MVECIAIGNTWYHRNLFFFQKGECEVFRVHASLRYIYKDIECSVGALKWIC